MAAGGAQQAVEVLDEGGFAGAGHADDGHAGAILDAQRDVA
jgi:hypothetical protein